MAEARATMYYIYFAKSLKNQKIYVGFTSRDPKIRLCEHNSGSSTWSNQNGPFELIYLEKYYCKEDAVAREKFYKSGFGKRIKKLICEEVIKGP
ncbi:MAG: GIY-YIG nuclease family protein [Candidatus Berkelbacteria bacterium]|nr:GIY-YIG nuclease family protein [Candidatus Berkelbacteria bacterium]